MKENVSITSLILFSFLLFIDIVCVLAALVSLADDGDSSFVGNAILAAIFISITYKVRESNKKRGDDKPVHILNKGKTSGLNPNFEIKYKSAEDEVTVRKVFVRDFDGKMLDAYCFLRNDDRTFYVQRIVECVDLETGEVLSNETSGGLRWYFNEKFKKNFKPSDMFDYREWNKISFSFCTPFLDYIDNFNVDNYFIMKIVTYKEGIVSGRFYCKRVRLSMYEDGDFYLVLESDDGNRYNVEPNKIISVEGVDDIGRFINDKFLSSDECKARILQKECEKEISILVYLGRADESSLNAKKRNVICNYLNNVGRNCSNEVLSMVVRKISVDTRDFKKIVVELSKGLEQSNKQLLLAAASEIVGGKKNAKPFALAGLLYLESNISI